MGPSFADVVLPVPLDQAFTYAVPSGMVPVVGARVRAPWGTRQLVGVVTALRTAPPAGVDTAKIKLLGGVLDAAPLLDATVLALVTWAAAYYQAPIGEVMRCALPPGGGREPRRRRVYRLRGAPPPAEASQKTSAAQQQAIEVLRGAGGEAESAWLRQRVSASALATLERRGWLERIETAAEPAPPALMPAWAPRPRITQLNPAQQNALAMIETPSGPAPAPVLLHGVTGSGKTAVYIAAIAAALERGESALLLVPEIGLTPALFADFEDAFPSLTALLHSSLGDAERAQHWRLLRAGAARVAVGTRSAVFAPLAKLGLIVVDEEHDASYKQQEAPRYHGRDLAVMRGKLCGARVVLGSATPSLESLAHARSGKYRLAEMAERVEQRALPPVRLVDMGAEFRRGAAHSERRSGAGAGRRAGDAPPRPEQIISAELRAALDDRLTRGQQALVLINRRGYAPVVLCRSCGASVGCRDCALSLTYHRRAGRLICHYCGYAVEAPKRCPACGGEHIYFLGEGSEKVEAALAEMFPQARLARLDRDTTRTRRHFETVLARFRAGAYDILIGTQMIAKGHDVPGVTLVGVLQADLGLGFPDFRAAERTFQLLTQVAGRAGRGEQPGEVFFQVQHPEHYAVACAARSDFPGFFEKEAQFRRWMHYPPYAALACVQLRHTHYDRVLELATQAGGYLREQAAQYPSTRILGPAPALLARAKTEYRFQFLFKSSSRRELGALLRGLRAFARQQRFPATVLVVDVDPLSL